MTVPQYTGEYRVERGAGFDPSKLKGSSVIVTGGASGIGEEMTKAFVGAGAFVTIGDFNIENGERVAKLYSPDQVTFVPTNVTVWEDQVNLFKTAIARSPSKSLDIVVSNAGISGKDPVWWDDSEFDGEPIEPDFKILKTNLHGCLYTSKLALHYLTRQPNDENKDRCLILMSSIAGYCEQPGAPVYGASKHGIRGVMQSLRRTIHTRDMRVNLLAPWYIQTPALPKTSAEMLLSKGVKFALASDAAQATLHIASDRQLNGRCLTIVPRDEDPRGYMDMNHDDYADGDYAATWQKTMIHASHRAVSKDRQ
jgi:NAD(P)-dependent dehydrogenase (short-subunit alcohol dehydrogenase family)